MNNSELQKIAKSVRKTVFEFKTRDGIGHLHSSLSPVDVLVSLFYDDKTDFNHEKDIVMFGKGTRFTIHLSNISRFRLFS